MATVNQKILNSINLYNVEKDKQLAETYVQKVSGKQLSTEDYTSAEKTKLAGIAANANKYVLPAATSSALGGVIVGDNISNASGKISISQQNVIGALGYNPADRTVGTKTALGLSKLYDTTGSAVDGSITQAVITNQLNLKAPLASPTLTGTPKAPTAAATTNTTQLATTQFVHSAKNYFGVCSTSYSAQNKAVTIPGFVLQDGVQISVLFTKTNFMELPTLNVNNTGAFPICYRNKIIATRYIREGMVINFVYQNSDGGLWHVIGEIAFNPSFYANNLNYKFIQFGKPYLSPTGGAIKNAIQFDGASCIYYDGTVTLGGADFTIDCWATISASHDRGVPFCMDCGSGSTHRQIRLGYNSGVGIHYFWYKPDGSGASWHDKSITPAPGDIAHYAFVYIHADKALHFYINGEKVFTNELEHPQANWNIIWGTAYYAIQEGLSDSTLIGAVDEFRISKCARWTSNFTPQNTAYEKDSDTVMLLHFD